MAEDPKWRKRKPKHKEPELEPEIGEPEIGEPEIGEPKTEIRETDTIETKIENVRAKKKGFTKLPHLENIYETPPIIEGLSGRRKQPKISSKKTADAAKTVYTITDDNLESKYNKTAENAKAAYKMTSDVAGSSFNDLLKQLRAFILKNAKYTDVFYDLDLLFKAIENSIVKAYNVPKIRSAEWFYNKKYYKQFENGVLDRSDVKITLRAEYASLTPAEKKLYEDMANAQYKNGEADARSDAKILTSNIRNYAMTFVYILISYNILYTWIIDDGKKQGQAVEENSKNVPDIIQFAAKPMFVLLYINEQIFNKIGLVTGLLDSVVLFTLLFLFVSNTGFVSQLTKGFSKLMVKSLTTLLNGKFSKSAFVYIAITLIWLSNLAMTIVKNPSLIAGIVPLGVMIFVYIVIIVLHCLFLGPSIGFAVSLYVVYRFLLLIPIRFGSKILDAFKMVDDKINEGIKVETDWKTRVYKHLFSIVFTFITIYSIFDFSVNLKNQQLRTTLPILLSAFLAIFLKLKYDNAYEVPVAVPVPVPVGVPVPAPVPALNPMSNMSSLNPMSNM
jgi:hypothetical protein